MGTLGGNSAERALRSRIGAGLRAYRVARNSSQAELAQRLGVHQSSITTYEAGVRCLGYVVMDRLVSSGASLDAMFLGQHDEVIRKDRSKLHQTAALDIAGKLLQDLLPADRRQSVLEACQLA